VFFVLLAQAGELGVERMIARHERFLAVDGRRVGAGGVFQAVNLASVQRKLDAAQQGRVGIGLEFPSIAPCNRQAGDVSRKAPPGLRDG